MDCVLSEVFLHALQHLLHLVENGLEHDFDFKTGQVHGQAKPTDRPSPGLRNTLINNMAGWSSPAYTDVYCQDKIITCHALLITLHFFNHPSWIPYNNSVVLHITKNGCAGADGDPFANFYVGSNHRSGTN